MQHHQAVVLWPRRLGEVLGFRVLTCLDAIGARAHVISNGWEVVPVFSRYIHRWRVRTLARDLSNIDDYDAWLDAYCRRHGIDIILPTDLETFRLLGSGRLWRNAARLFPTSDTALLDRVHDKWQFYQLLQAEGLPAPRTMLVENPERLDDAAMRDIGFPMVAKPVAMGGGEGIVSLASVEDAHQYVTQRADATHFPLLLQERVPGIDAGLSIFAIDGQVRTWTAQLHHPDRIEFIRDDRLVEIARRFAEAVQFTGVAHIDLMTDRRTGGYRLLECNPRFWASLNESMYHGVNFVALGFPQFRAVAGAVDTYRLGDHYGTKAILRRCLTRPGWLQTLSASNRRGFWKEISDPLPFGFKYVEFFLRKLGKLRRLAFGDRGTRRATPREA